MSFPAGIGTRLATISMSYNRFSGKKWDCAYIPVFKIGLSAKPKKLDMMNLLLSYEMRPLKMNIDSK